MLDVGRLDPPLENSEVLTHEILRSFPFYFLGVILRSNRLGLGGEISIDKLLIGVEVRLDIQLLVSKVHWMAVLGDEVGDFTWVRGEVPFDE